MAKTDQGPQSLEQLLKNRQTIKPPAHLWQDLALQIIRELGAPAFKRASVFKACKEHDKNLILKAFNDTKELCPTGNKWQYFFKVLENSKKPKL